MEFNEVNSDFFHRAQSLSISVAARLSWIIKDCVFEPWTYKVFYGSNYYGNFLLPVKGEKQQR
jgi:hypothetical protein